MSTVPTAVLFPGQGSQEPGMGRDVAEASKEAETYTGIIVRSTSAQPFSEE